MLAILSLWSYIFRTCDIAVLDTGFVGDSETLIFSSKVGSVANPVILQLGDRDWKVK